MPENFQYHYAVLAEASEFIHGLRLQDRETIIKVFRHLATNPYESGDFQEFDRDHGSAEVILLRPFVYTYYVDHAVREVRIIRVEPA